MSEQTTAPLVIRSLAVEYQVDRVRVPALDDVSFTIGRGEFAAVVGESGSGKSTLVGAVTGLLPPEARITGGEIALSGIETTALRERAWSRLRGRRVGLIPQDPGQSLTPVTTIGRQIDEIAAIRGERLGRAERRARAIELLEAAEVSRAPQRLDQYPHELSGGLKQRILIAIAFGLNPELLVADEPTSALDVTVQKQILRTFDRLAADHGTSVLFVTHDLAVATDHASRVLVMRGGRLVEDAPVDDVLRAPKTEYTAELLHHARATESTAAPRVDDGEPLLEVRNLTKVFAGAGGGAPHTAVDDVSFTLGRGETLALVGESGSGKSTTARMILRLEEPTGGSVLFSRDDVTTVSGRRRRAYWRDVQMVYQNPDAALDPRWTVQRIVAEPLRTAGALDRRGIQDRVAAVLDAVALPPGTAAKRPGALSGGQRQRVAIARALAPESSVVVLDEALSALDVITQESVIDLLARVQGTLGVSFVFISHDLSVVRRIAHRIVVMQDGRVVEQGETAQIFDAPQTEYVRALIAAVPGARRLHLTSADTDQEVTPS
ncbi:ABC transporter ATP-binding protein [Agromyces atrinae]|uniref:ABC transporter ATP-binding protein n=1 Tax=Agromyces atrinae TaxID=592376 RepID=A0A4Q2M747_9MICO|nr:ABC transporter ATP-binding protein [Agromyces atrinae]NYD68072.1 peptide/nickel transport system ATP-binding protein [Agromyces atrinae]RXZ87778.1 ABC transporter ATP-binding protein [Agromyces atrinae]